MGQRPQIKRAPGFISHLGGRILRKRQLTGKPPPPPPEASKLADDHYAITLDFIKQLGIDANDPPTRAKINLIDHTFRQIVGL